MRRLLVTGGAGFIGSHFAEHCLKRGLVDRLVVLDAMTYAGDPANLEVARYYPGFRFVEGDVCDLPLVEALLREERLDGIVNFAAETSVDRSIQHPGVFQRTNVQGVLSLLDAARRVWCSGSETDHRFHQISTDEVFGPGAAGETLRDESVPYAPTSPYAATKAAADLLVRAWRKTYGLKTSISYSSNVYGPRQQAEKLIPLAIECLMAGRSIPVYGDGLQSRNWIFVADLCRALEQFLTSDTEGRSLYLGSETEVSNLDLLNSLVSMAGCDSASALRLVADRPGHDRRYGISSREFRRLSGYVEQVPLHQGLSETWNWYRERRARARSRG